MADFVIPVAFWADTQAEAEAQALAWARQPSIAKASVKSAEAYTHQSDRWAVVLDVEWATREADEPLGLGL